MQFALKQEYFRDGCGRGLSGGRSAARDSVVIFAPLLPVKAL
jgi:hypothetical protein